MPTENKACAAKMLFSVEAAGAWSIKSAALVSYFSASHRADMMAAYENDDIFLRHSGFVILSGLGYATEKSSSFG